MNRAAAALVLMLSTSPEAAPPSSWTEDHTREILEKTQTIRLDTDLSPLSAGERAALAKLLEAGALFQDIYEESRHPKALELRKKLDAQKTPLAGQQRTLYRLFQGPIANTLQNERMPFLPTDPVVPGKNVYPWGITKAQVRTASRAWGLPTWDKPAAACLSSRIAYGLEVTPAGLARVERAEEAVRRTLAGLGIGSSNLRVRDLGDEGSVQLDPEVVAALGEEEGAAVRDAVVAAGFATATVDARGFRSGSMNERLPEPELFR